MGKSAYPTAVDLSDFLTAAGVRVGTLDLATAATAGWVEFEKRTQLRMLVRGRGWERDFTGAV